MSTSTATDNILDIVEAILKNQELPDCQGALGDIRRGETPYGIINTPIARHFHATATTLASMLENMKVEHQKFHECVLGPTGEHTCEKFSKRATTLSDRIDVINALRWQAMREEYPASFATTVGIGLREGWTFVALAPRRSAEPTEPSSSTIKLEAGAISRNLIPRIAKIILEPPAQSPGKKIDPVAEGEEVIGEVTDSRIQALFNLSLEIREAARKALPTEMPWPEKDSAENLDAGKIKHWLRSRSQDDASAILDVINETDKACGIVSDLAWRAVRDSLGTKAANCLELRDDWKIIKKESEEESLEKLFGEGSGSHILKMMLG